MMRLYLLLFLGRALLLASLERLVIVYIKQSRRKKQKLLPFERFFNVERAEHAKFLPRVYFRSSFWEPKLEPQ